jgi:hypothetical protein
MDEQSPVCGQCLRGLSRNGLSICPPQGGDVGHFTLVMRYTQNAGDQMEVTLMQKYRSHVQDVWRFALVAVGRQPNPMYVRPVIPIS